MRTAILRMLLGALLIAGCQAAPDGSAPAANDPAASIAPVVREVLAAGRPATASEENLELVRFTIQPGAQLPPHRHPGLQLAWIEAGTLTYTVVNGTVTVHQRDGHTRTVDAGETDRIVAGEWLTEADGVTHFGQNEGAVPLVILAASLLDADQPPAILVSPAPS